MVEAKNVMIWRHLDLRSGLVRTLRTHITMSVASVYPLVVEGVAEFLEHG